MNNNISINIEVTSRNAYAKQYYLKNAQRIRESSRKSHAKLNARKKVAMLKLLTVLETVGSLMNDEMEVLINSGYEYGMSQFNDDIEFIKSNLCGSIM